MFIDIVLKTAVAVGLVSRSVNVDGTLVGGGLLLLGAGGGEVLGQDGSLAAVAIEDVVVRAVDVVVVAHSANVLDGLDAGTRKSTVGLFTSVDRRVRGHSRSSRGLLSGDTVGIGLRRSLV